MKEEAIKMLRAEAQNMFVNKNFKNACEMGAKSLEAWEIVRKDIKQLYNEVKDDSLIANGVSLSLKIIDKRLKEIEE